MHHLEFSRAFALFFVHPPTVLLEQLGVGFVRFSASGKDNESSCYVARAKLHRGTGERLSSLSTSYQARMEQRGKWSA